MFFFYFKKCIVPVRIRLGFQNMCKHLGLTEIILNKISQSLTNLARQLNSWDFNSETLHIHLAKLHWKQFFLSLILILPISGLLAMAKAEKGLLQVELKTWRKMKKSRGSNGEPRCCRVGQRGCCNSGSLSELDGSSDFFHIKRKTKTSLKTFPGEKDAFVSFLIGFGKS